jgi:REP element-mobilizing transposase RayT
MTVTAVDRLLDRNMSQPELLGQTRYASIVKRAITRHDGKLYSLHAWVVMPNHVHLLIEPRTDVGAIGRLLMDETEEEAQAGMWVRESYERSVDGAIAELVHSIENHPVKARLVARPEQWEWSSARAEPKRKPMGNWSGRRLANSPAAA